MEPVSKEEKKKLEGNFWKYQIYNLTNKNFYWPLLNVFFLSFPNHTLNQIGLYSAIGNVIGFMADVPSGYFADKIGHKRTMVMAKTFGMLSSLFFLIGGNFWFFVLGMVFMSLTTAFNNGTTSTMLRETLIALGRKEEFTKMAGKISSRSWYMAAVLLIIVPFTAKYGIRWPFFIGLCFDFVGWIVSMFLYQPRRSHLDVEQIKSTNFIKVFKEARSYKFFSVLFLTEIFDSSIIVIGIYRDVYQKSIGINIAYLGALLACSRLIAAFVSARLHHLELRIDAKKFFLYRILVLLSGIYLVGLISNKFAVATLFILVVGIFWGTDPLTTSYQLKYVDPSKFKATMLSFAGQMNTLFVATLSLIMAQLVGHYSYAKGYLYFAIFLTVIVGAAYINFRVQHKESVI